MVISPQIVLFLVFMLVVVQATRLDEMRQRKREANLHGTARATDRQPARVPRIATDQRRHPTRRHPTRSRPGPCASDLARTWSDRMVGGQVEWIVAKDFLRGTDQE